MDASGGADEVRVLVAASPAPWTLALAANLARLGFSVCTTAEDAPGAMAAAVSAEPDICVLAADLPGSAVVATARISEMLPLTRVLIISDVLDDDDCLTYLVAGASGYVGRTTPLNRLQAALRATAAGEAVIPEGAKRRLLDELRSDLL